MGLLGALFLGASVGVAAPAPPRAVAAGLVCAQGEVVGEARVEEVLQHAEFERCMLRLPDGALLTVEVVGGEVSGLGACDAQGYALQPRWELLGRAVDRESQPAAVRALCARLAGLPAYAPPPPPPLVPAPDVAAAPAPAPELPGLRPVAPRPALQAAMPALFGLGAVLFAAALPVLAPVGRRRWAAAALVLALALVACAAAPGGLLVGPDGGYIPLAQALGAVHNPRLYGVGWAGLMAPVAAGDPLRVFVFNRWIAPLWPLLALLGGAAAAPSLRALPLGLLGLCAAGSLAFLRLVGAEAPHLLLLLIDAAALALLLRGLARPSARGALAAGLLCGLAPHLRPEALLAPALPLFALAFASKKARWSLLWALPGASLGLGRAAELLGGSAVTGAVRPEHLLEPSRLQWVAADGVALPLGVAARCLVGAAASGAAGGRGAGARLGLVALALSLGPVASKWWPMADGWRLQLPSFAPTFALAAIGAERLGGWTALRLRLGRALAGGPLGGGLLEGMLSGPALLLALAALSGLGAVRAAFAPWSPRSELDVIAALVAALPPDATLLLADDTPNAEDQRRVVTALGRAGGLRVLPMADGPLLPPSAGGLYAFAGLRCAVGYPVVPGGPPPDADPCAALAAACRLKPLQRWEIPSAGDLDLAWPAGPLTLTLSAVEGCATQPRAR